MSFFGFLLGTLAVTYRKKLFQNKKNIRSANYSYCNKNRRRIKSLLSGEVVQCWLWLQTTNNILYVPNEIVSRSHFQPLIAEKNQNNTHSSSMECIETETERNTEGKRETQYPFDKKYPFLSQFSFELCCLRVASENIWKIFLKNLQDFRKRQNC